MLELLQKLDAGLGRALKGVCILCMIVLCVVLAGVVLVRFFPFAKLSWSDEIVELAFAWMVFMGAAALWREKAHFCVDALSCKLEEKLSGAYLGLFIEAASLVFCLALANYGYMLASNANDRSPILEWPKPLWYSCIPLAGAIMALYSVRNLLSLIAGMIAGRGGGLPNSGQTEKRNI